jgi:hypothetical protein
MYATLVTILAVFFIMCIILLTSMPEIFNKYLGYQMMFTGPMLALIGILLSQKKDAIAIGVGIFTFFMMLYIGGIFSENPPENNTATMFTAIAFFIFIAGAAKLIKHKNAEPASSMVEQMRTKYTLIFAAFAFLLMLLYFWNPGGFMTTYFGPVMFFSLFIGVFLFMTIWMYNHFLGMPGISPGADPVQEFMKKMLFALVGLALIGLLIWGALKMFGIFNFESEGSSSSSIISILLNMALLFVVLGFIYKYLNLSQWMSRNPIWNLLVNIVFYVPCLFTYGLHFATGTTGNKNASEFAKAPFNRSEIGFFLISVLLLSGYLFLPWLYNKYLKNIQYKKLGDVSLLQSIFSKYGSGDGSFFSFLPKGHLGKLLVEEPIPTNHLTNVTSFPSLSETEVFDRQFAMSMWFYLDSFSPSTSSAYSKMVPLLSYGDNPAIRYSSELNTLFITTKNVNSDSHEPVSIDLNKEHLKQYKENIKQTQNMVNEIEGAKLLAFGTETDADGNRIIYKHSGVMLQKWNHVLINMNGGTMDVFYNGVLVKTAIGVVPYVKNDMLTIGCEGGVSGSVAGLTYFDHPLDITTINEIYVEFKDQRVPFIEV